MASDKKIHRLESLILDKMRKDMRTFPKIRLDPELRQFKSILREVLDKPQSEGGAYCEAVLTNSARIGHNLRVGGDSTYLYPFGEDLGEKFNRELWRRMGILR